MVKRIQALDVSQKQKKNQEVSWIGKNSSTFPPFSHDYHVHKGLFSDISIAKVKGIGVFAKLTRLTGNDQGFICISALHRWTYSSQYLRVECILLSLCKWYICLFVMVAGQSVSYAFTGMYIFSFNWYSQIVFQTDCTNLHFYIFTTLDTACISRLAILVSVKRCLIAVSVCILLFLGDHLVLFCLVPFTIIHFYVGLFAFNCYSIGVLYILGMNSLLDICSANNFSDSGLPFPSFNSIFWWPEVL